MAQISGPEAPPGRAAIIWQRPNRLALIGSATARGKACSHGGIDRIATRPQDLCASLCRIR